MSSGGMGGVGVRHHGVGDRMSPLEIGMYVLLAAFCFAIVVFVVSCVVYASKFKPQPPDSPMTGAAVPVLSGAGARARAAANQLASGRRPPRESTTNAHDWVWLGRATLERAACGPQQVRVTSNPLAGEGEADSELGTCFDNPNHIELPSANQRSNGGTSGSTSGAIDTTTYCKKDRMARNSSAVKCAIKPSAMITPTPASTTATTMSMVALTTARNDNDDIPPPLPPHGVPATMSTSMTTATTTTNGTNNVSNGNNEDYKPPVPPHRNTGVNMRLPEPPRKHRHRASSGSSGGHHGNNHRHSSKQPLQQTNHHIVKPHGKPRVDNANKQNGEDEEFVELVNHDDNRHLAKDAGRSREIKRATIVGNPMYSSFSTPLSSAIVSTVNSSTPTGGAASSTTTSPPSSSPSASSTSSSASSSASSSSHDQEESVALDDLNLGMDYNQIMQYFDNLKESNA